MAGAVEAVSKVRSKGRITDADGAWCGRFRAFGWVRVGRLCCEGLGAGV
jgi:hypothetical protein